MNTSSNSPRKFCFISNSDQSYLNEYIDLSSSDSNLDFAFDNIDFNELEEYNPNIIIIDQYFYERDCAPLLDYLKNNFKESSIYFLSPEYSSYKGVVQSEDNENHYYSNFIVEILNHINAISKEAHLEVN